MNSTDGFFYAFIKNKHWPFLGEVRAAGFPAHWQIFAPMVGCQQDPIHHPEGDAWIHTWYVVDEARKIGREVCLSDDQYTVLIAAALLHDIGKPSTTKLNDRGRWSAIGHEHAGVPLARTFLDAVGFPQHMTAKVLPLIENHMVHYSCKDPSKKAVKRLLSRLQPADFFLWSLLCQADHCGRPPHPKSDPTTKWMDVYRSLTKEETGV